MTATTDPTAWIGRQEETTETLGPWPLIGLAATLDRDPGGIGPGTPLPPLAHWLYFLPRTPARDLGPDGHAKRGGFLPPIDLPRRMWAGGRLRFLGPLTVGETALKRSTIRAVTEKNGKSGRLVFVTVGHQVLVDGELRIDEEQDIVYRPLPEPGTPVPPPPAPPALESHFTGTLTPDAVMLFRYSALTFNGHRIHYDIDFCRDHEGYPGLVVHGPLTATLLADLAQANSPTPLATFSYRGTAPLFHDQPVTLNGHRQDATTTLWATAPDGHQAMHAEATS
ncbi:FAS1-like dehydratase domain-containing protein [Roseospirillum parvum]|uniref:3-methylfumaryl-CoA hydratase n=1 Tax=Roseospirillum parvum TaxID=83401 RepID=A0A1G7WYQ3_9PROT|nr:MaoC family dehydratase N-terminal domain-containing protein [Roseospirillum parvum]SDG77021.1 3-methylfumaryl-CoA hydratase [Roseospirillum parvum]